MSTDNICETPLFTDLALFEPALIGVRALFTWQLRLAVCGGKVARVRAGAIVRAEELLEPSDRTLFAVGNTEIVREAAPAAWRAVNIIVSVGATRVPSCARRAPMRALQVLRLPRLALFAFGQPGNVGESACLTLFYIGSVLCGNVPGGGESAVDGSV